MSKRFKTKHKLYARWILMRHRCRNSEAQNYKHYGARGIDVCEEWYDDFWSFVDHIESLPNAYEEGRSIDRIDNDKGYFPGNIRWATRSQQSSNRRRYGKGYYFNKHAGKYHVQVVINGKQKYFGLFKTEEEAKAKVAEVLNEIDKEEGEE